MSPLGLYLHVSYAHSQTSCSYATGDAKTGVEVTWEQGTGGSGLGTRHWWEWPGNGGSGLGVVGMV